MGILSVIFLVFSVLALSVGVVFGEFYLSARKNVFYGLIPSACAWALAFIVLLVMLITGAGLVAKLVTFFALQLPVVFGVASLVYFRTKRREVAVAEKQKEERLRVSRRMEEEKHRRLLDTLRGFVCAESSMKPEGQREIVVMSKSGKTVTEISEITAAAEDEVGLILASFGRYNSRLTDEAGSSDLILTPAQEELVVSNLVNSLPFDHSISAQLWTRQSARALAAELTDASVSLRITSAYLRHWGFTVPVKQTIKFRSSEPETRSWLAGEFEQIRKKAAAESGEILWVYTVSLDSLGEITSYIPGKPVMVCAVSNDGSLCFKVYSADNKRMYDDFADALAESFKSKLFVVVNENYDEFTAALGREKLKLISGKAEFFRAH